jgi:subtilisin family serine protease
MKKFLLSIFFLGWIHSVSAQEKYWVLFTDKPDIPADQLYISPLAAASRTSRQLPVFQPSDLPVHRPYVDSLVRLNVIPLLSSKWLNGVSAYLTETQLAQIRTISFVKEIRPIDRQLVITASTLAPANPEYYATVMSQIEAAAFVGEGLTGKGVKVGVIDVGFYGLTNNLSLKHLIKNNQIADVKDYVNPAKTNHFSELETYADDHGTTVLQMITGFDPDRRLQHGAATNATFYLARTDHGTRETRSEEDNWVVAMERMDSLGVRLINTSLGYALGFTDPKENYKPSQMDGKTSTISQAAQIAADEKGILIVVSAGNEGDDANWRIVSTPADSKGVISVGATGYKHRSKVGYSSIGPNFLPYLKPNVSCYSATGTSFSAPVITGFAACLMEKDSSLTNAQLTRIIEKSAHLYPYGNNYIGYGVPNAAKALQLIEDSTQQVNTIREIHKTGNSFSMEVNSGVDRVVVFHKTKGYFVLSQTVMPVKKGKIEFKRMADEDQTTIDLGEEIVEVFWSR